MNKIETTDMILNYLLKEPPRLTITLLFFALSGILTTHAQTDRLNLDRHEMSAGKLLRAIEAQTNLRFAYSYSTFDTTAVISMSDDVVTLRDALDCIVADKELKYVLQGNYVAFVPTGEVNRPQIHTQRTNDVYERSGSDGNAAPVLRPETPQQQAQTTPRREITLPVSYPAPYSDYKAVDRYSGLQNSLPRFAIKTNLLYSGLALAPNLAFEFATAPRQTIELSGSYNGWYRDESKPNNTKQLVHTILRAEYRWWMCERYNGHFFGAHGFYTAYHVSAKNVPMIFDKDNRYKGYGIGIGGSYGYNLPLNKRWGLEFNIGVGAAYFKYDKYSCAACDRNAVKSDKWYIGPTRAGITLVFQFK